MGTKYEKHRPFYANPAFPGAFFQDANRKTALPRRIMYAQEFNRDAVRCAEPRIAQCVAKFFRKLDHHAQTGRPANLTKGLMCLMVDNVMNFMYQKPYGALDANDFESDILVPMCQSQIEDISLRPMGQDRPRTVFDTTLNPNLEKGHKILPVQNLAADAFTFVMAGTDTSSHTLVIAVFNLLHNNPTMLDHLKHELRGVIHDREQIVGWAVLEKLPYL
ncbi:MAG: hypothetical protein Q9218_005003, partial [Villophora microphyllina]